MILTQREQKFMRFQNIFENNRLMCELQSACVFHIERSNKILSYNVAYLIDIKVKGSVSVL